MPDNRLPIPAAILLCRDGRSASALGLHHVHPDTKADAAREVGGSEARSVKMMNAAIETIQNILSWVGRMFHKQEMTIREPEYFPSVINQSQIDVVEKESSTIDDKPYSAEFDSDFNFKKDILDSLGDYFPLMKAWKAHDPVSYDLYSKIGINFTPLNTAWFTLDQLNPWWRAGNRPSFGGIMLSLSSKTKRDSDNLYPRFAYFIKIDRRWDVQPADDMYACNMFYTDEKTKMLCVRFYVSISDGNIRLLKQLKTRYQNGIPCRGWDYPYWFSLIASDPKHHHFGKGVDEIANFYFSFIANASVEARGSVQVLAEKRNIHAVFSVNPKSTKDFFNDREAVVNSNGKTKRIFHSVKPHERSNGAIVKMHFRGLRDFVWNGYNIHISVPGKHHPNLNDLEAAQFSISTKNKKGNHLSQSKMGNELLQIMKQ